MKSMKMLTPLLLAVLLLASTSFAAMTCTDAGKKPLRGERYEITVECVFDTTPATAVDALPDATTAYISRGYIYTFSTLYHADALCTALDTPFGCCTGSGTGACAGVTDDSDLQIVDAKGITIISATGNGADIIDNAANNGPFYGDNADGGNHYPFGDGNAWTVTVTNNAVNNSSFSLVMEVAQ